MSVWTSGFLMKRHFNSNITCDRLEGIFVVFAARVPLKFKMSSVFKNVLYLSRLFLVINRIGNTFLNLKEFSTVVERFVFGYDVHQVIEDSSTFAAETISVGAKFKREQPRGF